MISLVTFTRVNRHLLAYISAVDATGVQTIGNSDCFYICFHGFVLVMHLLVQFFPASVSCRHIVFQFTFFHCY